MVNAAARKLEFGKACEHKRGNVATCLYCIVNPTSAKVI